MIEVLKSKIHRATVTDANLNYEGSITISQNLIDLVGLREYEKVAVVDVNNGNRLETYVIATQSPQTICLNGAAARLVSVGDKLIIMAYELFDNLPKDYHPKIVVLNDNNEVKNDK